MAAAEDTWLARPIRSSFDLHSVAVGMTAKAEIAEALLAAKATLGLRFPNLTPEDRCYLVREVFGSPSHPWPSTPPGSRGTTAPGGVWPRRPTRSRSCEAAPWGLHNLPCWRTPLKRSAAPTPSSWATGP